MHKNKLFLLLALFSLLCISFAFAAEMETESRIAEVTVYPDSALISRVASLKLSSGEYKIIFPNIIPDIDEASLRVSAQENAGVKLFGAQVKKEFLEEEAAERVRQIKEEIQKLQDEIQKLQNDRQIISEEKQFLDSIRLFSHDQLPRDLVTKTPAVKDLDDMFKFMDVKLKDSYAQIIEVELKTREAQKKIEVLKRQLAEVSGPQRKLRRSIVVDLEALKPAAFDLKVSYLVRGASWQPIYDARADFEKSEVELVSYGIIRQNSGEDWQDVEMSLSTAKPAIGGNMPYVAPWVLRPYQPHMLDKERKSGEWLGSQKMAFISGAPAATVVPADEGIRYAKAEERGIAIVYKLPKKASIKADGTEYKLPVSTQVLTAKFEYSSYPRSVLNAYLGSRVTNAPNLQLLGGRVNIFLAGDFVGSSSIDNIGPGEEFDLYLGMDENVKVKREQIEKKVDETLIAGIPSPTKRTALKYKLTVENYKSKKINVKLFEAMPVSEDDRIKVKIEKLSLEPKEKDWKDRKGVWLWELELEPKQKKEIIYTFIIEHPREMLVEGL